MDEEQATYEEEQKRTILEITNLYRELECKINELANHESGIIDIDVIEKYYRETHIKVDKIMRESIFKVVKNKLNPT
ncbi:MAG: hypothetical protein LBJ64_11790 [Deltaproteobacteria bacterium]|jgi:hypothetical protein|nr:hypothetical protein [Deltaproteobacteria bacterium]